MYWESRNSEEVEGKNRRGATQFPRTYRGKAWTWEQILVTGRKWGQDRQNKNKLCAMSRPDYECQWDYKKHRRQKLVENNDRLHPISIDTPHLEKIWETSPGYSGHVYQHIAAPRLNTIWAGSHLSKWAICVDPASEINSRILVSPWLLWLWYSKWLGILNKITSFEDHLFQCCLNWYINVLEYWGLLFHSQIS